MEWLGEGIKQLPNNLQKLELNLNKNIFLGRNAQNLKKYLGEGMKYLPKSL